MFILQNIKTTLDLYEEFFEKIQVYHTDTVLRLLQIVIDVSIW